MVMTTDAEGSTLQLRDVRKSFPDPGDPINRQLVLPGISVTLAAGELVSLIGPSGCGKSTLLRLIAGLETADAGVLLIGSEAIRGPSAERGLVFQDPNLFPWLTVRRNIEAGLVARGVLQKKRAEVDEFMRLVELEAFAEACGPALQCAHKRLRHVVGMDVMHGLHAQVRQRDFVTAP